MLPPFSLQAQSRSQAFKEEAFKLKVGEVSGPVQSGESYHLIKVEEKISPKAVKFEDPEIRAVVREWVSNTLMFTAMQQLRGSFAEAARDHIEIRDPVLREQYQQKIDVHNTKIKDHDSAIKQIEIDNEKATTRNVGPLAATQPATQGAIQGATQPATHADTASTLPATVVSPTTRTTTSAPAASMPATAPQVGRPPATTPGP